MVTCAKCTPARLLGFLKSVKTGSVEEIKQSASKALQELKNSCFDWGCSKIDKDYEEYCQVKGALEDIFKYLDQAQERVSIGQ